MGYHRAGFDVTGVDHLPQKHYPFTFIQADALAYVAAHGHEYDVIHASPPCQAYSALKHLARAGHPELVAPVRSLLMRTGKPYVIENVVWAPLDTTLMLCGSMFGLETSCGAQLRRHRLFESNFLLMSPGGCRHGERTLAVNGHDFRNEATRWEERRHTTISVCGDIPHNPRLWRAAQRGMIPRTVSIHGDHPRDRTVRTKKARTISITGTVPQQNVERNRIRETFSVQEAQHAMGISWMPMRELSQAIPPAYTEWIGRQLQTALL
jgi:DNA (cytosine-5)-methyltransferase 1